MEHASRRSAIDLSCAGSTNLDARIAASSVVMLVVCVLRAARCKLVQLYHHQDEDNITYNITILSLDIDGVRDTAVDCRDTPSLSFTPKSDTNRQPRRAAWAYRCTLHVSLPTPMHRHELLELLFGEKNALRRRLEVRMATVCDVSVRLHEKLITYRCAVNHHAVSFEKCHRCELCQHLHNT